MLWIGGITSPTLRIFDVTLKVQLTRPNIIEASWESYT